MNGTSSFSGVSINVFEDLSDGTHRTGESIMLAEHVAIR